MQMLLHMNVLSNNALLMSCQSRYRLNQAHPGLLHNFHQRNNRYNNRCAYHPHRYHCLKPSGMTCSTSKAQQLVVVVILCKYHFFKDDLFH